MKPRRTQRISAELSKFLRQYGRRGASPHDPNDRAYDRKLEAQLKRMDPLAATECDAVDTGEVKRERSSRTGRGFVRGRLRT